MLLIAYPGRGQPTLFPSPGMLLQKKYLKFLNFLFTNKDSYCILTIVKLIIVWR